MITIREADRHDVTAISELVMAVAREQVAAEFPPEGQEELLSGMTPEAIEKSLSEGYRYYLAIDRARLCGAIGMRGYSHIYHLFVAGDSQRRDIGRQLWNRARDASLADIRLTEFTVFSSRYAEAFYRRLGFRRTGPEQTRRGVTAIPMRLGVDQNEPGIHYGKSGNHV